MLQNRLPLTGNNSGTTRGLLVSLLLVIFALPSLAIDHQFTEDFSTQQFCDTQITTALWDTDLGEIRLPPFEMALVGSFNTPLQAKYLDIDGDYLYLADRATTGTIIVVDISDPTYPSEAGSINMPDEARSVVVEGNYAYVACASQGLQVVDISDPTNPAIVGSNPGSGFAHHVAVAGDYAYVASGGSGLLIYDISDPLVPVLVGNNPFGNANYVKIAGGYAFVGTSQGDLETIDISDPTAPIMHSMLAVSTESVRSIALAGDYIFICFGMEGLKVLNVGNPIMPGLVGELDTPSSAESIFITGNYAYVADGYGGDLLILDISDPVFPVLWDSIATPGDPNAVLVDGEHAFVGDGAEGLTVVKVADMASSPLFAAGCLTQNYAIGVNIEGNYAYIANGEAGLQVINILDPVNPFLVGSCDTPGFAFGLAIAGNYAYVADREMGLEIIDISNPLNPVLVSNIGTAGRAMEVTLAGHFAYVADNEMGFEVIDISNPLIPILAGNYDTIGNAFDVTLAGNYAYLADTRGLQVIDISNPANPFPNGSYISPSVYAVAVAGDFAFVANFHSPNLFQAINISNPTNPMLEGSCEILPETYEIALSGNFAYLASVSNGLQVIDISNPMAPVAVGNYDTPSYSHGVALDGQYAFVADQSSGLQILEISNRTFDRASNVAQSQPLVSSTESIICARVKTPQTNSLLWELSLDGGSVWEELSANAPWYAFTAPNNDLMWRSTLQYQASAPMINPTCTNFQLDWLYEFPLLTSATDVPVDQGGQVLLNWAPSAYDISDLRTVTHYSVWRALGQSDQNKYFSDGSHMVETSWVHKKLQGPAIRIEQKDGRNFYWEWLTNVDAYYFEGYGFSAPTYYDSTGIDPAMHYFQVVAHTSDQWGFWISPVDSGYSVDNLAPQTPQGLVVAYGVENELTWEPCADEDFQYFRIYRGSIPDFEPTNESLVHTTTNTEWVDVQGKRWGYFYKLSTIDHAGNESAITTPEVVSSVEEQPQPDQFLLHQNVPNPFNPSTKIYFDIPAEGGLATLDVFDTQGRFVCRLLDDPLPPGTHSRTWRGKDSQGRQVASGVYFCRLKAGGYQKTQKMLLMQ